MSPIIDEPSPGLYPSPDVAPPAKILEFYFQSQLLVHYSHSDAQKIERFNSDPKEFEKLESHYKYYPRTEIFPLKPNAELLSTVDLARVFTQRTSCRRFRPVSLPFEKLSTVLRFANGLKDESSKRLTLNRTLPSGGATCPLEVYLVANFIEDLPRGLYHYNLRECCFERLWDIDLGKNVSSLIPDSTFDRENFAGMILISGVFARTLNKYGMRGWRMILSETGNLVGNLWLLSEVLGIGGCAFSGGYDRTICRLLRLQPHQEGFLMSYIFGTPE